MKQIAVFAVLLWTFLRLECLTISRFQDSAQYPRIGGIKKSNIENAVSKGKIFNVNFQF